MTDEIISPLLYKENDQVENNEENIQKKEEDINDNELENLLNNEIRNKNDSHIRQNFHLSENQKKGLAFLSFAIQLFIFYLLLYLFFNENTFKKTTLDILFFLSIILLFYTSLIHFRINQESFKYAIKISLISTICIYILLYNLITIFNFNFIKNILFANIIMYLSLFLVYFFYNGYPECFALLFGGINSFLFCFIIVFIRSVRFFLSSCIFFQAIFLMIISFKHIEGHHDSIFINHFDINNCPRLFLCLHADLYLLITIALIIYYFILYLLSFL